jgi:hypothetical protein
LYKRQRHHLIEGKSCQREVPNSNVINVYQKMRAYKYLG